jgi:hypothetical protein
MNPQGRADPDETESRYGEYQPGVGLNFHNNPFLVSLTRSTAPAYRPMVGLPATPWWYAALMPGTKRLPGCEECSVGALGTDLVEHL